MVRTSSGIRAPSWAILADSSGIRLQATPCYSKVHLCSTVAQGDGAENQEILARDVRHALGRGALPWGIIPPATRPHATQRMSDCGQRSWPEKEKDDVPHHGHPASRDGQEGRPRGAPLSCTRHTWRRTPSTGLRMLDRPELQGHGAPSFGGISCRHRVQFTSWSFDHGISLASERVCASSPA
jgi:hypothetical protein